MSALTPRPNDSILHPVDRRLITEIKRDSSFFFCFNFELLLPGAPLTWPTRARSLLAIKPRPTTVGTHTHTPNINKKNDDADTAEVGL